MKSTRSHERGQALVEFALVSVFSAFLLFFAVFDIGRALFSYDLVAQAARVGTRFAIVNAAACTSGNTAPCERATTNYMLAHTPGIDAASMSAPVFTWESASATCPGVAQPGCTVKITVTYAFAFLAVPNVAPVISSSSQLVISQ